MGHNDVQGIDFPPFFSHHHIHVGGASRSFSLDHDVIAFARLVKDRLKRLGSYAFTPMLRADVVIDHRHHLLIMECESFEAATEFAAIRHILDGVKQGGGSPSTNGAFASFLNEFWFDKLKQLIQAFLLQLPESSPEMENLLLLLIQLIF